MAKLIKIESVNFASSPSSANEVVELGHMATEELESGNILFFQKIPFDFPKKEIEFLLNQKQTGSKNRKNIAYKPDKDCITNFEKNSQEESEQLLNIMRNYSQRVSTFLSKLLTLYAKNWRLDYASFRPFQERGRNLRLRARNDLLHTDAFPSRPMHGDRILRFFTNINQKEARRWITSEPFDELAEKYGGSKELPFPKLTGSSLTEHLTKLIKRAIKNAGVPLTLRSPYDDFMLRMHHFLKENKEFQENCTKDSWEFPPNSCWAVFTDQVSHAALEGQYALEQTFLIPRSALLYPEKSPISVLERLCGQHLVDPVYANF